MKKSIIICVVAIVLLLILLFILLCGPALFGGQAETTEPFEGDTTVPDTTLNGIQEGIDWEDEIDLIPTDADTTVDVEPTDPPTTGTPETPTDPPSTGGNQNPTDPPTEVPSQDGEEQTTQDGIDLPLIPG